jgi:hypothetical protein
MDHLFIAPTFMCAATLAATLDDPAYRGGRRGLVVTNNSPMPQVIPDLLAQPGFSSIAERFDAVVLYNDYIAPEHPRWPQTDHGAHRQVVHRILGDLGLGRSVSITAQSIHVWPSAGFIAALPHAPIHVISDGLMSYGPTRIELPHSVSRRLARLVHLDLVPGVKPNLLAEFGTPRAPISGEQFQEVVDAYAARARAEAPGSVPDEAPDAIMLGQYLAALKLLTPAEEEKLHLEMLRSAIELGARTVAFKPHPSSPPSTTSLLFDEAERAGVTLSIVDTPLPVEALIEAWKPRYAIGCFSTGLATSSALFGIETWTIGTERVAANLPVFEDSNRVPLMISFASNPSFRADAEGGLERRAPEGVDLQEAIDRLSERMQPGRAVARRHPGTTEDFLGAHPALRPFFDRRPDQEAGFGDPSRRERAIEIARSRWRASRLGRAKSLITIKLPRPRG